MSLAIKKDKRYLFSRYFSYFWKRIRKSLITKKFDYLKFLFICFCLFAVIFSLSITKQQSNHIEFTISEPEKGEFRFAAIGDTGTGGKNQNEMAQKMLEIQGKTNFNLLLFLGDNIYESGSPTGIEQKFLKPYAGLFQKGVELRGAIGNHDARDENGIILQQLIFNMGSKTYYSFEKKGNLVEFFAIDSNILIKSKKPDEIKLQLEWFEKSLAKSKARWKIAFLHHPIYSSGKKHGINSPDEDEMKLLRHLLEPLYLKYGVQVSLNGHDHVYERTKPINGVQYFTSGAGAKLRKNDLQKDSPYFAFGNDQVRSFMLFSAKHDSLEFWSIDIDGNVLDSGTIKYKE